MTLNVTRMPYMSTSTQYGHLFINIVKKRKSSSRFLEIKVQQESHAPIPTSHILAEIKHEIEEMFTKNLMVLLDIVGRYLFYTYLLQAYEVL